MYLIVKDILDVAIKSEESSCKFYKEMSIKVQNPVTAKVLTKLAQDEQEHLDYLLWLKAAESINDVYFEGFELAGNIEPEISPGAVLEVALKREGVAAKMYRQMAEIFKPYPDKSFIFERMAREEDSHSAAIVKMMEQF